VQGRLFQSFADGSALEGIALKAAMFFYCRRQVLNHVLKMMEGFWGDA